MSLPELRQQLAQRQEALLRALVAGGAVPADFDASRVRLAARSLVNKRLREVRRAWPSLEACLGERFAERFRAYAEQTPPPAEGGPRADGLRLARSLPAEERSDELERALFLVDLHAARWPGIRWCRLPRSGRRLLGLRLPGLGVRVIHLG